MSNLPELTPDLAEALRKFRAGYREHSAELADAFAALYPEPELQVEFEPGVYQCSLGGVDYWLVIQATELECCARFNFIGMNQNKAKFFTDMPSGVTNIRRIDDCPKCAEWKEWAETKWWPMTNSIGMLRTAAEMDDAFSGAFRRMANELTKLLETS